MRLDYRKTFLNGRKKMILIGLAGIILTFLPIIFVESLLILRVLLFIGGFFWACININSLPMVVELAAQERIGSFTGYYYFLFQRRHHQPDFLRLDPRSDPGLLDAVYLCGYRFRLGFGQYAAGSPWRGAKRLMPGMEGWV